MRLLSPCLLALAALSALGCSADFSPKTSSSTLNPIGQIQGRAFGGQQPVKGMQIYLLAASTAGYGSSSVSLLTSSGSNTSLDTSSGNYYVTTDANGFFGLSGDYTCAPGQQLYLYGVGGDPGTGTPNTMVGMMSVLGQCPASGTMAAVTPYVWMNEVTTIAAAYAMAGFAVDPLHVSASSTTFATTGLATAFANAGNLVNLATGTALTSTPSGTGTVPATKINTLANILASCVNSDSSSTSCSQLQALTPSALGTSPADTAAMAINIAHLPANNVADLFGRAPAQAAFVPSLSAAPADFSLTISFTGPLMTGGAKAVAIDGSNQVWIASATPVANTYPYGVVDEFSPLGVVLSGQFGYQGVDHPQRMAFDTHGNVFVAGYADSGGNNYGSIEALTSTGYRSYSSTVYDKPKAIVTDTHDDLWAALSYDSLFLYTESGSDVRPSTAYSYASFNFSYLTTNVPAGMTMDASNNLWTANTDGTVSKIASTRFVGVNPNNTYYAANPTYSVGGSTTAPIVDIAFDGHGHLWEADRVCTVGTTSPFSCTVQPTAGTGIAIDGANKAWTLLPASSSLVMQPGTGTGNGVKLATGIANAADLAVDSAGNIWIAGSTLGEVIGVAGPVRVPAVYQRQMGQGTLP